MPNFVEIAGTAAEIAHIFRFFKMAAAVILEFKIFKFLTVGHAKKVELPHCAKFLLNRSSPLRHMVIFLLFKMAAAVILNFRNFRF